VIKVVIKELEQLAKIHPHVKPLVHRGRDLMVSYKPARIAFFKHFKTVKRVLRKLHFDASNY
jgi:hypothetical protein